MPDQEKHITTVNLDRRLWKRARKRAIDEDSSVSAVVEEALREWLDQKKPRGTAAA